MRTRPCRERKGLTTGPCASLCASSFSLVQILSSSIGRRSIILALPRLTPFNLHLFLYPRALFFSSLRRRDPKAWNSLRKAHQRSSSVEHLPILPAAVVAGGQLLHRLPAPGESFSLVRLLVPRGQTFLFFRFFFRQTARFFIYFLLLEEFLHASNTHQFFWKDETEVRYRISWKSLQSIHSS